MFKIPPAPFKTWGEYRVARDAFYRSAEWLEIRRKVIQNSDGRCVYCGKYPTKDNPINIDHRIPLCKRWELRLSLSNLQLTCHKCNKYKSGMSHKQMLIKTHKLSTKRTRLERKRDRTARRLRKKQR